VIGEFLQRHPLSPDKHWRLVPTFVNGQPGFGHYLLDQTSGSYVGHGLNVLTLRGAQIAEITAFVYADSFPTFGLAGTL
jgi:RNA polymerase sigma-70 factor (ECF subfamily)